MRTETTFTYKHKKGLIHPLQTYGTHNVQTRTKSLRTWTSRSHELGQVTSKIGKGPNCQCPPQGTTSAVAECVSHCWYHRRYFVLQLHTNI